MENPFRYYNSSPEIIRLTVMMYVLYPLLLRQVEDLLFERGIDICYETVRFWWNCFGPMFAAEIRKRRVDVKHLHADVEAVSGRHRQCPRHQHAEHVAMRSDIAVVPTPVRRTQLAF